MLPIVVTYSLPAGNATSIVNANAATTGPLTLATTQVPGTNQRRLLITSSGNDSAIFYHVSGTNQAGFPIGEFITGVSNSTTNTNLDYLIVASVQPSNSSVSQTLASTAATVSVGVYGVGSSPWNFVNWHAMPSNISYGCVLQTAGATFSIQYTYDDANNLPSGVLFPQAFNHPTINNVATTIDGFSNDPITAWRLQITAGTGTVRATGIQGGIGSP